MSTTPQDLPPSANGPFYTLVVGYPEDGDEPLLVHCETLEEARQNARCWQGEVIAIVLDSRFEQVKDQRVD